MFKKVSFSVALLVVFLVFPLNSLADKSQIINDVLSEKGFYDANVFRAVKLTTNL